MAWLNNWNIPELSKQTLVALNEADKAKRQSLYTEMQKELQRSSPYVFIDQGKNQIVLRDNVKAAPSGDPFLDPRLF